MKTENVKNRALLIFLLRQKIRINSGRNYSQLIRLLFASVLILSAFVRGGCFAQNIGINTAGASPHASAILDIDVAPGNNKGWLIPRVTTVQRNAIAAPAHSLMIYNITTDCFEAWNQNTLTWVAFGCIGCQLPGAFSATAASGIAATSFSANWSGSGGATAYFLDVSTVSNFASFVAGYNNLNVGNVTTLNVTGLACGTYYYRVRANNTCGKSTNSGTITVTTVLSQPSIITGTSPVCQGNNGIAYSVTNVAGVTYTWTYSGTGYTQASGGTTNSITANFSGAATSGTLTVTPSNACGNATARTFSIVVNTITCPASVVVNHTIGVVAPETKSVTYGVVSTSLSGTCKCWITQNLGSTNQASSATDNTDASAGWYWQFNRKQGYKVGPTPAWTITAINEASDWLAANDPCTIELGAGWRIPTNTEWTNVDANGLWANYTDAYNSVLKLHAAGFLNGTFGGPLNVRGTSGYYPSSTQSSNAGCWTLTFDNTFSTMTNEIDKALGFSIRCIKD